MVMKKFKNLVHKTLLWSEKYTKTDMVYLAQGGFWLIAGHAVVIISGIITSIAFANLIPKEQYGVYQFVISFAVILGGFTLTGMGVALSREAASKSPGILKYAFKTKLKWSLAITGLSLLVSLYYFLNENIILGTSFIFVGILTPIIESSGLYRPFLKGLQLFKTDAKFGLLHRPLPVIALIIALFLTNNPLILVIVYYVSHSIASSIPYKIISTRYSEETSSNPRMITYSKHLSLMGIISRIANNIDKILVFHFLGAVPVAIYTFALLPLMHMEKIVGLINDLIFPKFARKDFHELKKSLPRKTLVFLFLIIILFILYILAAPYIYNLIFPQYHESIFISQILMLALLVKPVTIFNQVFHAHGINKAMYINRISTPIVKLILLFTLLPVYGIWGAVYAILITKLYTGILITILFYTHKYEKRLA
jgi:O-antigen/teichoic acid export membrane protein